MPETCSLTPFWQWSAQVGLALSAVWVSKEHGTGHRLGSYQRDSMIVDRGRVYTDPWGANVSSYQARTAYERACERRLEHGFTSKTWALTRVTPSSTSVVSNSACLRSGTISTPAWAEDQMDSEPVDGGSTRKLRLRTGQGWRWCCCCRLQFSSWARSPLDQT